MNTRDITRYLKILITAATLLLAACTVSENGARRLPTEAELEQYNASVEPEDRIVCRDETPVGTRISQRICRRVGKIEETAELTQGQFRRILR